MRASVNKAISLLNSGEVIAYPTEGVWGLGCDPNNEDALKKLISLKKRDPQKGLILVGSDILHFSEFVNLEKYGKKMMEKWPGPHTWIVPSMLISPLITGESTSVALRLSDHQTVKEITETFGGAITSSSANIEGKEPAKAKEEVEEAFKETFIVDGELGNLDSATPIQDLISGNWIRM